MALDFVEESIRYLFYEGTKIHRAAYCGDSKRIKRLLQDGADVNCVDINDATPLHLASWMLNNQTDTIREILDHYPQMNLRDNFNRTPLNILVARARYDEYLLGSYLIHGADPNVADIYGHTSFHQIVKFPHANRATWLRCIKLLMSYKADVNFTDKKGNTVLHKAAKRGFIHVVDLLLKHNANINLKNRANYTPFDIAFIFDHPAVLDRLGKHSLVQYSLNMAVDEEDVKMILEMKHFKKFWKECNTELDQLKKDKIGDTVYSYFHMMTLPTQRMSKIFLNKEIETSVFYYETNIFKIYEQHLCYCLVTAMTRNYFVTNGTQFCKHVWPWMEEMIIDKITSFLSNAELFNLAVVINKEIS